MRNWTAAWAVGALVLSGAAASGQSFGKASLPLTVTVHVSDYAHLSPSELAGAESIATSSYRAAGLDLNWTSAQRIPEISGSIHVRLVILTRDMADRKCRAANLGEEVLGTATSDAGVPAARVAWVFYHRIVDVALSHRSYVSLGLGHVMAHEVGHLLLGTKGHSSEGLMTRGWNPLDSRLRTFTDRELETIRRRFPVLLAQSSQTARDLTFNSTLPARSWSNARAEE